MVCPSRASKPPEGEDFNQTAFRVVRQATEKQDPDHPKNPAACGAREARS
jgi:hypothetical protein